MGAPRAWITQFAASSGVTPPPSASSSSSSCRFRRLRPSVGRWRTDGVQLRGHDGRGGPVPRPAPPPPQRRHHPDGRRGGVVVAARHAPELLVRVLRRRPQPRRRGQVRVRAPDARGVLQVPPPPHQLPGPRPPAPVPAHLPRRRRRRRAGAGRPDVLRLLPHRRGPVSHRGPRNPRKWARSRGGQREKNKNMIERQKKGAY
ncbi:hypothetical protein PVAP13_1NG257595 [Panicum virgatum]|uniref:Uncharacterized protein n=1 Tax=Panicum virgatum TaxID=38727 RepID=A0A8T0X1T5_PANVG|nr:hypothetical protein PVAP13_1NG257595 [Panicum virgatum]